MYFCGTLFSRDLLGYFFPIVSKCSLIAVRTTLFTFVCPVLFVIAMAESSLLIFQQDPPRALVTVFLREEAPVELAPLLTRDVETCDNGEDDDSNARADDGYRNGLGTIQRSVVTRCVRRASSASSATGLQLYVFRPNQWKLRVLRRV